MNKTFKESIVVSIAILMLVAFISFITMTGASYTLFVSESNPSPNEHEFVVAYEINYIVLDIGGIVNVRAHLRNSGSTPVQIVILCVHVATKGSSSVNFCPLDIDLQPAQQALLDANVTVIGVCPYTIYHFDSWLVTAKHNIVGLPSGTYVPSPAEDIWDSYLFATNLDNFMYFNITDDSTESGISRTLDNYPIGASANLINQGAHGVAFQVSLINIDERFRDITLSRHSCLYAVDRDRSIPWFVADIANVDETTGAILDDFDNLVLPYGVEKKIYFTLRTHITYTGTVPVCLLLLGKLGDTDLGRNLPFPSIFISR